jgi:hypothetical protein
MWVGYLPWRGDPFIWTGDGVIDLKEVDYDTAPDSLNTYTAVFAFRELAFNVVGFTVPIPSGAILRREIPSMRRFWPPRLNVEDWPPNGPPGTQEEVRLIATFNPLLKAD